MSNCAGKWNIKYYGMECIVNYQRSEFRMVSRLGVHVSARVLWCGGAGAMHDVDVTTITKTIKAFALLRSTPETDNNQRQKAAEKFTISSARH